MNKDIKTFDFEYELPYELTQQLSISDMLNNWCKLIEDQKHQEKIDKRKNICNIIKQEN